MDDHDNKAFPFTGVCEGCGALMAGPGTRHRACAGSETHTVAPWKIGQELTHPELGKGLFGEVSAQFGTQAAWERMGWRAATPAEAVTEAEAVTADVLRDTIREALEGQVGPHLAAAGADAVADAIVELFEVRLREGAQDRTDPVNAARRRT